MITMEQQNTVSLPTAPINFNLDINEVKKIVFDLYGLSVVEIQQLNGYDDKNYHIWVSEKHEESFVLKVINLVDSQKPDIFDAQSLLLVYLDKHGINCPTPILTKNGKFFETYNINGKHHIVRILKYIDGEVLEKVLPSSNLFYRVGKSAAIIDNTLKNFWHPAYTTYQSIWFLESVAQLPQFLFSVKDIKRKNLVETIVNEFAEQMPILSKTLERGLIHGDLNTNNIIVENQNGQYEIKAIIDFGDCHIGCYLYELAIVMTYMIIVAKDIEAGRHVFLGYSSVRKVTEEECSLLKLCIAARFCQSVVIGTYAFEQDPKNTYVMETAADGWPLLEKIWYTSNEQLIKMWKGC